MKNLNLFALKKLFILLLIPQFMYAANEDILLKSKSTKINMKTGDTEFHKNIVINNGNLKILAGTLSQKNNKQKNLQIMELTGNPARVEFKRKNEDFITTIFAKNIHYYPDKNIIELNQETQLQIAKNGNTNTQITADKISMKFNSDKIETINALGTPLTYNSSSAKNKEPIKAKANALSINYQNGDVELFSAVVKQADGELRAGKIIVDGETGNLSANTGDNQMRPSFSIDLEKLKQQDEQP